MTDALRTRPAIDALDPVRGWWATLTVTAFAFLLRVWDLRTPNTLLFDETYYAKDAWSMHRFGYVRTYVEDANDRIADGRTSGLFADGPSMIVHPAVGKWIIAAGESVFGMNGFGWRISSAVVGALMVMVMVRLARRVTGSTLLGVVAGLLVALDGVALVLSRLALLDIYVAFFLVCAVSCMVADRDQRRRRFADRVSGTSATGVGPVRGMLLRPWLAGAGVAFGLSLGTKWSNVYALAAMGLLVWAWDVGLRRRWGARAPVRAALLVDAAPAFVQVVLVALVVYVVSWSGWLLHADVYEQAFSNTQYGPYWGSYLETDAQGFLPELAQSLRSLWHYHLDVYTFHTQFLDGATHVYQSDPAGWLVLNRPVGIDAQLDIAPGEQGCAAAAGSTCLRQVLLLGTPAVWWFGSAAGLVSLVLWIRSRDWRDGLVVVGALSTWLPWLQYADRPIFSFYAISTLPFLVLAAVLVLGRVLGRADASRPRRRAGAALVGAYVVLVVLNAGWFWPIWTDELLTNAEWLSRIWFDSWI